LRGRFSNIGEKCFFEIGMTRHPQEISSFALFRRLLWYVRPYRLMFLVGILAMICVAATEPLFPWIVKLMLDRGFIGTTEKLSTYQYAIPIAIIAVFAIRGFLTLVMHYCLAWVGGRVLLDLREAMFVRLLTLPASFFDNSSSGHLVTRITHDVTGVTNAATTALTVIVRDTLATIALIGYMLYLNWALTLIALITIPPMALAVRRLSKRLRAINRASQQTIGDISQTVQEGVEAHKVIKVYGGQSHEASRMFDASNKMRNLAMKESVASSAMVPITQLCVATAIATITFVALKQAGTSGFSAGGFAAFLLAMLMILSPVKRLADVNAPLQRGLAAAESVFSLMDSIPETNSGTGTIVGRARGEVSFERVSFAYDGAAKGALREFSLKVSPGQTLALVGTSGAGKSTITNLMLRLYDPIEGRICLDGFDIRSLKLESLREQIALVSQDVVLFNDTVAANIAYGKQQSATPEQIWAAAKAAYADGFISEMPNGLQSVIGENGVKLSGGQRQRIAIARAILKDAPILILDEATSALDSESERQVQNALEHLMNGRTTIVVAHRLSTIERADNIAVLDRGTLIEFGPHEQLLSANGVYANLYRIQYALGHELS
jgi:ATP-binding cassette, subfamily B, bacterial MsbA